MARHRDSPAPSPAGSHPSKRLRREDDRYERDRKGTAGGGPRRRSRSPSLDVSSCPGVTGAQSCPSLRSGVHSRNDIETVMGTAAVIGGTRTCIVPDDETAPVTDGGQENETV